MEEQARRRRLRATGRPVRALIIAARPTGGLEGTAPLVEFELELLGEVDEPRRRLRVTEAVPLVLTGRAQIGMSVDVYIAVTGDDGLLLDWSG